MGLGAFRKRSVGNRLKRPFVRGIDGSIIVSHVIATGVQDKGMRQTNNVTNHKSGHPPPQAKPPPLCDIPSGCCFFTGPWTVTRSSLRMLRRVAAFCRLLRPVLLLVSFPRSRSPVVGVPGAVLDVAGCAVCV